MVLFMDRSALFKMSYGLYVLGVQAEQWLGGCVVDAFIQATSDLPPMVVLSSAHNNFTNNCIKKHGEFTVSILADTVDPFVIANFGFQSARNINKWANVSHEMRDGLPVLTENCAAYLRCVLRDQKELSDHTLLICEVIDAWKGTGAPLIYGDYQKSMKTQAFEAFSRFKKQQAT